MFTIFNDTMANIKIISASIRDGKKSDRVALYLKNYITANNLAEAEVLDLSKYNFPLFTERFKFLKEVSSELSEFVGKVNHADAVIIVTPEYNGGYPAALKNIIDVLVDEWKHKPVAISTVSSGPFGGSQSIISLQFSLWKIGAYTVPAMFPVPTVENSFSENGLPSDSNATDKRAANFLKEILWYIKAKATVKL